MKALSRLTTSVQNGSARRIQFRSLFPQAEIEMEQSVLLADAWAAYGGSMDAALAFFEGVVPGWDWGKYTSTKAFYATKHGIAIHDVSAKDAVPSRALLTVALLALAEERGEREETAEAVTDEALAQTLTLMAGAVRSDG